MIIRTRPTTPPPAAPILRRPPMPESVGAIVARTGLGWRGQGPTTAPRRTELDVAPGGASSTVDRTRASGPDPARRSLLEAELFLGYGLDDASISEVIG